jgi:hypothetical protein
MSLMRGYLPPEFSLLSLGIKSDFKGELTTEIKTFFYSLVKLPNNRIVTSNSYELKVWNMTTDELLLTIIPPFN